MLGDLAHSMTHDDDWQREMQRYLAHFHRAGKRPTILFSHHPQASPAWAPAMDMYETPDALVIQLALAGIDASQTEVRTEPHVLIVRGARRAPSHPEEQRSYHALEIPYGRFERSVRLPPGLDTDAAQASYRDGLLEIKLPKRVARQVPITLDDPAHAS